MIALSNDPGLTVWGMCLWIDHKPVKLFSVKPQGPDKFVDLPPRYATAIDAVETEFGKIAVVAFEEYGVGIKRARSWAMTQNTQAVGLIKGYWLNRGITPIMQPTGSKVKAQAPLIAYKYFRTRRTGNGHERDALLIGELAGFGRK